VVMLVRGDSLGAKMSQYLVDRIQQTENMEVRLGSEAVSLDGQDHLESVTVHHCPTDRTEVVPGVALYIFIGAIPCTGWLDGVLQLDEYGFIKTGDQLHARDGRLPSEWAALNREPFLFESSLPGVFVVGDARSGSIKRVASAVGEGSVAVQFIHQYLAKLK
jgi:thioredoxin reductase (NADPH)